MTSKLSVGRKPIGRTAVFTSGSMVFIAGQFVFLWLLARLGDPALVGTYGLATAILNPLFYFTKMGMRQAQAADPYKTFSFFSYQRLRNLFLIVAFVVGLGCVPLLPEEKGVVFVFISILVAKIAEALSDLYYGLLLQKQSQHVIGISMILRSAASVGSYLATYLLTGNPMIAIIGMPLGWIAVHVVYDRPRSATLLPTGKGAEKPGLDVLRSLFLHLWPLAVAGVLIQVQQSFPRLLVATTSGLESLGAIVPALQFYTLVMALSHPIVQSLLPRLAMDIQNDRAYIVRRQVLLAVAAFLPLLLIVTLVCFVFGEFLVTLVFGVGYELSGVYLGLTSISWSLRLIAAFFQNVVVGAQYFRKVLCIHAVVTTIYCLISIVFWMAFGIAGIFYALIACNSIHLALFVYNARVVVQPKRVAEA